jgi:hypothetical protein
MHSWLMVIDALETFELLSPQRAQAAREEYWEEWDRIEAERKAFGDRSPNPHRARPSAPGP